MKNYRVYCLDGASRIQSVEIVEAVNDAEALVAAKKLHQGFGREVWDRDRLVGKIQPKTSPSPLQVQRSGPDT
jgi:hypothetical protein